MKVTYLRKLGQHKAGTVVDLDESSAQYLIDNGLAEEASAVPASPSEPTPAAPAPADAKPPRRRRGAADGDDPTE